VTTTYIVTLEGVLPMIGKIQIEADNEWEAGILAERIAESQRSGVKASAIELEAYSADWLVVEGINEITVVGPDDASGKIWKRDEIETLLDPSNGSSLLKN
jgi:hypothetical protein